MHNRAQTVVTEVAKFSLLQNVATSKHYPYRHVTDTQMPYVLLMKIFACYHMFSWGRYDTLFNNTQYTAYLARSNMSPSQARCPFPAVVSLRLVCLHEVA
eukprot:2045182-Amphidinium_carterae.2